MTIFLVSASAGIEFYPYGYVEYPDLQSLLNDLIAHGHTITGIPPGTAELSTKKGNLLYKFRDLAKIQLP